MFWVSISNRISYLGCILLICLTCFRQCASQDWSKDTLEAEKIYNQLVKWQLSPIGRFASDIVGLVMINSSKALNETLKSGGEGPLGFVTQAMFQNLTHQIGLVLCVVIGILICLVLIFLPCCLCLSRSRQKKVLLNSVSKKRIDSKSKVCCQFEIFIICIIVAMLGAVIVISGAIRSYYMLQVPFGFANFTVKAAFDLKLKLQVNHQNRLNDVSRSAFDVIKLLNNVNEDVSSYFMDRLQEKLDPILNIASSVKWELVKVIQLLESDGALFNKFINETMTRTNTLVGRFIYSAKTLKELLGNTTTALDPFMSISVLSINSTIGDGYSGPIPTLREVSKIKIDAGLHEIRTELKHKVIQAQYDPSNLTEKLKHAAFQVQKNLDASTEKYISHINAYVKDTDREPLLEQIGKAQNESIALSSLFNLAILVLAILSLVFAIALFLAFHCGVCGTCCFRMVKERNRKVFLRSSTSHCGGRCILFFCYLMSLFLWVCWLSCVILFFLTSLPLACCRAMKDYSILDMTFDSLKLRTTPGWYSLLTSDTFNMTLKQTVIQCQKDISFVPTIPDPLVDTTDKTRIKSELDLSPVVTNFSTEIRKLSPGDFPGFDLTQFNFEKLLDDIDISPPFTELQSFLKNLTDLNVTDTVSGIKKGTTVKNVTELADNMQRVYNFMLANVSTALANNGTYLTKIKSANITVKTVVKHIEYLNWTADALYSSILNDSVDLFNTSLDTTINKLIDGIFVEMQLAAVDYRKSMSLCGYIVMFYEKATGILCNVLLYPVACCWFGFFVLDVFLVISIVLSLKSARSFLYLPDVFLEERVVDGAVKAADLPTRGNPSISSGLKEYEDEEYVVVKKSEVNKNEPKDSEAKDEDSTEHSE